ncbi:MULTISPECIES: FadR/GntR family transcriptional regulator [unclassified Nocardioides]|uniref:FadR/GntR family transcriptional regulator n=1 Tax=unclassified Nocardioides TaxID=2615069 RepID=UPI00360A20B7
MATPTFQPAKPRRAFDEIIAQVREMVRKGELVPGDRLPAERQLAEQFAVSRNTVREALRMLEISGLVQLRRGASGGAFIAEADPSKVASSMTDMLELNQFSLSDLTEARGWLESVVARIACERADEAMLARLDANVAEAAQLSDRGDWERKALVNVEFHNLLAEATGNPVMVAMMRGLMDVMAKIVLRLGPTEGDVVLRSRRRFMKHLHNRDAEAAVAEMYRHLERMHKLWVDGYYKGSRLRES